VWPTNAFANTGEDQRLIVCTRAEGVPAPVADITKLPDACTGGATRNQGRPAVAYFDRDFRFQQAVKYALGVDRSLTGGWNISADASYTVTRDHVTLRDRNLVNRGTSSEGRTMYGSITTAGEPRPTRVDSASFGPVYEFANATRDWSEAVTLLVRRDWQAGGMIQAGYTWSRTRDAMSMLGFSGNVIFRNNTVDGSLERRRMSRSNRDIPHNLTAAAVVPARWGLTGSLFLRARSGAPYGFTVNGDANADGAPRNDLAYIPAAPGDIDLGDPGSYAALDSLIERVPCLRSQRGMIMRRNSCRNPAVATLDGRLTKKLGLRGARRIELSADVFNLPNLINRDWGIVRETTPREDMPLVVLIGWNPATNRPRYAVPQLPRVDQEVSDASRWRAQLGARYEF
jgi:hypothetical protein